MAKGSGSSKNPVGYSQGKPSASAGFPQGIKAAGGLQQGHPPAKPFGGAKAAVRAPGAMPPGVGPKMHKAMHAAVPANEHMAPGQRRSGARGK